MKDWIMEVCPEIAEWQAEVIAVQVRISVEAEREACAKACEDEIKRVKPIYSVTAENALKAIRARGEE
jgi:hypothetical protein